MVIRRHLLVKDGSYVQTSIAPRGIYSNDQDTRALSHSNRSQNKALPFFTTVYLSELTMRTVMFSAPSNQELNIKN
jgi:hypothetical protein